MSLAMTIPPITKWPFVGKALLRHLLKYCWLYALAAVGYLWVQAHYQLAFNLSDSLPNSAFLVVLGEHPDQVGQYVAFEWRRNDFYSRDWTFIKRVSGVPGQTIKVDARRIVSIDDHIIGYAKTVSKHGHPLEVVAPGVIPPGYLFASTPHPDSLDSRYRVTGLIEADRVIGRAYALW